MEKEPETTELPEKKEEKKKKENKEDEEDAISLAHAHRYYEQELPEVRWQQMELFSPALTVNLGRRLRDD